MWDITPMDNITIVYKVRPDNSTHTPPATNSRSTFTPS